MGSTCRSFRPAEMNPKTWFDSILGTYNLLFLAEITKATFESEISSVIHNDTPTSDRVLQHQRPHQDAFVVHISPCQKTLGDKAEAALGRNNAMNR